MLALSSSLGPWRRKFGIPHVALLAATFLSACQIHDKGETLVIANEAVDTFNEGEKRRTLKAEDAFLTLEDTTLSPAYKREFNLGQTFYEFRWTETRQAFVAIWESRLGRVIAVARADLVPAGAPVEIRFDRLKEKVMAGDKSARFTQSGKVDAKTGRYLFEEYEQAQKRKCLYFVNAPGHVPILPAAGVKAVVHGALCNPLSVPISEQQRLELINTLTFNPSAIAAVPRLRNGTTAR